MFSGVGGTRPWGRLIALTRTALGDEWLYRVGLGGLSGPVRHAAATYTADHSDGNDDASSGH